MSKPQPHTVLCVDHESSRLYAEMIQAAEMRPFYWVRPIALKTVSAQEVHLHKQNDAEIALHDLRHEVDLLLPCCFFRPALDVEFISLLTDLLDYQSTSEGDRQPRHQLQQFIYRICKAHPQAFDH